MSPLLFLLPILLVFVPFSEGQCTPGQYSVDTKVFAGTIRDIWPCSASNPNLQGAVNLVQPYPACGSQLNPGVAAPPCVTNNPTFMCATDFERASQDDLGLVQYFLDPVTKIPALDTTQQHPTILNPAQFPYWYQNVPGFNIPFTLNMTANNSLTCNSLIYQYDQPFFFPLDGLGFGNIYNGHNYGFTFTMHLRFTYQGIEKFSFRGDDDVWVFINNQLAIDLGGVHSAESATLDLTWPAAGCAGPYKNVPCANKNGATAGVICACLLGLQGPGNSYAFDLYYNERHTKASDLQFTTDLFLQCPYVDYCGVCQGDGQSCCKCPQKNCFSCKCDAFTGAPIYTPAVCPAAPNACNNSVCDPLTGLCGLQPVICTSNSLCQIPACNPLVGCTNTQVNCQQSLCNVTTCDPAVGCRAVPIPGCIAACVGITCPTSNACYNFQCDPTIPGCTTIPTVCDDNNLCTLNLCDNTTGCSFPPISCDDGNNCTIDTCVGTSGCVHTPVDCNDGNLCNNSTCDPVAGGCVHTPIPVPKGTLCLGIYCDPKRGLINVTTVCPTACPVLCDDVLGCQGCPTGFSTVYQVATGIGAGIIALIVILAVLLIICAAVGGKKGYDAYMKYREGVTSAVNNPMYESAAVGGDNPFFEGK